MTDSLADDARVPDDYRNQAAGYRAGWNDRHRIAALEAGAGGVVVPTAASRQADGTLFWEDENGYWHTRSQHDEPALAVAREVVEYGTTPAPFATPQADPAPPVAFRNLPDGASFEDYREQLAVGNLTAVDQMAFDNRLHDREQRAEAMAGVLRGLPKALWPIPPEAMGSFCISERVFTPSQAAFIEGKTAALLGLAAQEGAG